MATIMEKDVLIEVVASGLALISRRVSDDERENNQDRKRLIELRRFLYSTYPEKIDYDSTLAECKAIKQKYLGAS